MPFIKWSQVSQVTSSEPEPAIRNPYAGEPEGAIRNPFVGDPEQAIRNP